MSKKEQIRDFSNFIKKVNAFLFSKNVFMSKILNFKNFSLDSALVDSSCQCHCQ